VVFASFRLAPSDDPESKSVRGFPGRGPSSADDEDLPYKVELWSSDKETVDQVLAVTASGSIGYAAYYAATKEFPDRFITLRRSKLVISRWNGPTH
jgi:hypothetical protein